LQPEWRRGGSVGAPGAQSAVVARTPIMGSRPPISRPVYFGPAASRICTCLAVNRIARQISMKPCSTKRDRPRELVSDLFSAHCASVAAGEKMRVEDRMQVFASRGESDRAWLLHAWSGSARMVAAFLSRTVAAKSGHGTAAFVPRREGA
jgi:hypothetical protein